MVSSVPADHGIEILREFIPVCFRIMEGFQGLPDEEIQSVRHVPLGNMRQLPMGCMVIFKKDHQYAVGESVGEIMNGPIALRMAEEGVASPAFPLIHHNAAAHQFHIELSRADKGIVEIPMSRGPEEINHFQLKILLTRNHFSLYGTLFFVNRRFSFFVV